MLYEFDCDTLDFPMSRLTHQRPLNRNGTPMRGAALAPGIPKVERGQLAKLIPVRVDDALLQRIERVVLETGRKRSDVMRLLMVSGLEQHEAERGKKR